MKPFVSKLSRAYGADPVGISLAAVMILLGLAQTLAAHPSAAMTVLGLGTTIAAVAYVIRTHVPVMTKTVIVAALAITSQLVAAAIVLFHANG